MEEPEYGCMGAGIGSGIENTNELKVLGYEEAMASPIKMLGKHQLIESMITCSKNIWEVVKDNKVPHGADIIDLMCTMKKKANGEYSTRLAARHFKQTQGKSFVHHDISSPVIHDIMVQIMLVLILMGNMVAHVVDVMAHFCWGNSSLTRRFT